MSGRGPDRTGMLRLMTCLATLTGTLGNLDGAGQMRALADWRNEYESATAQARAEADAVLAKLRGIINEHR